MPGPRLGARRAARLLVAVIAGATVFATAPPASAALFPEVIPLPPGWQPEGIASGRGTTVYSGSRASGDIVAVDVLTGAWRLVVDAPPGRTAIGIEQDRYGRFWVAGGASGDVYVYGPRGEELAVYDFATGSQANPTFVNDVVVTRDAAWFTDSRRPVLYKIPIGPGGALGPGVVVPLSGDYQHVTTGPNPNNLNGIDATPDGRMLLAVQSNTGAVYNIDPRTGRATRVDLGGVALTNGDGIYLEGRRLYVVQNRDNRVTVVQLDNRFTSGRVIDTLMSGNFDVPTTITRFGNSFYLVNARFGTAGQEPAAYWITAIPRT